MLKLAKEVNELNDLIVNILLINKVKNFKISQLPALNNFSMTCILALFPFFLRFDFLSISKMKVKIG